jgi:glycosyltransferase involved in cell wall biosynthesis
MKGIGNRIVHRASAITTISENSKKDIMHYYGVPADKIHVTYLAAHQRFFQPISLRASDLVRRKYHLPKDFLFYVGGIDPRKNVSYLLRGFAAYSANTKKPLPLVFAGHISNQKEYPEVQKLIQNLGLEKSVLQVGYVAEEDLPCFFSMANAFLFPSLYEGFGLPVIQAMAAGCPVITTKLSSIPEVAGEAALFMDTVNPASIAECIDAITGHPELKEKLVKRGKQQARKFSWEQTAKTTVEVYLDVAERMASVLTNA